MQTVIETRPAADPARPTAIEFGTLSAAVIERDKLGGWIFASDCGGRFIVFPFGWRPREIMLSAQTRGASGSIV